MLGYDGFVSMFVKSLLTAVWHQFRCIHLQFLSDAALCFFDIQKSHFLSISA